jgi:tetratricopeptide (TPR) repeat protein
MLVLALCLSPLYEVALAQDDEMRQSFEAVINDLNDDSFKSFLAAINTQDMLSRIYGTRDVAPQVKSVIESDFKPTLQQMYLDSFPRSTGEIVGEVVDFQTENGRGRAVVRFSLGGYRYTYHVYELAMVGGRLRIVDWINYHRGNWFSDSVGLGLVMSMPSKPAVRNLINKPDLSDGLAFQLGELFKAVRDNEAERYYQIYDGLDASLRQEKVVIITDLQMARLTGDANRLDNAIQMLTTHFPDDQLQSLMLAYYYIGVRRYEDAITELSRLQQSLQHEDGVIDSYKATAALAMSDLTAGEEYALQAVAVEPDLELVWWTLLRARVRAADYAGATEALTMLADEFGEVLTPVILKKDQFLKVLADQQEYRDWLAARPE